MTKFRTMLGKLGFFLGLSCLLLAMLAVPACAPAPPPEKPAPVAPAPQRFEWKFSQWGSSTAMTKSLEWWAKEMEERTGGRLKIEFHWGETLSPVKENLDGVKAGLFEMAIYVPWYTPGKAPLQTVFGLPFLAPHEIEQLYWWYGEGVKHPALAKGLEKWNAKPVMAQVVPQYQIMSTKPIRKTEDFKGLRIRIGADQGRVLEAFGAVPTMFPSPEIYGAIDKGMLDATAFGWTYGFGAYKMYEVCDYAIPNIDLGVLGASVVANKDAWAALPEDIKRVHEELLLEYAEVGARIQREADEKWLPIFKEHTEFIQFPPEERAKLIKEAERVWEEWVKAREAEGLPGREVLDFMIEKTEEAEAKH